MPDEISINPSSNSAQRVILPTSPVITSGELSVSGDGTTPAVAPVYIDPRYTKRIQPYVSNGLEIASANPNVVDRDENNNIILEENGEENQKLLIEQNSVRYTKESFARNIDTQFKHFKFPPNIRIISTRSDELEIPEFEEFDIASARYKPNFDPGWHRMHVSYNRPTVNGVAAPENGLVVTEWGGPRTLVFDQVVAGALQSEPNKYIVTPEIITFLNGRDLKMKFKVDLHAPTVRTNFKVTFHRSNPDWRSDIPSTGGSRTIETGGWGSVYGEIVIKNRDIRAYDMWKLNGVAGNSDNWYIAPGSYWEITVDK